MQQLKQNCLISTYYEKVTLCNDKILETIIEKMGTKTTK